VYRRAQRQGKLRTRIRAALPLASWRRLREEMKGPVHVEDGWLRLGCLKAMLDGSLGSHTAAFLEDYTDTPGAPFLELSSHLTVGGCRGPRLSYLARKHSRAAYKGRVFCWAAGGRACHW
jgi:hypothetical protein